MGPAARGSGSSGLPVFKICPPGMPVYLPLSVLVLQTSVPLLIRLSRKFRHDGGAGYLPASITLLAELAKCVLAFGFMVKANLDLARQQPAMARQAAVGSGAGRVGLLGGIAMTARRFVGAIGDLSALVLPAMLYFASNVTAVYALSHVRSYIFTAIMNSRIVFAAVLSLVVLDKTISTEQWRAILIIFCSATVLCLEDVQVKEDFTVSEETIGVFISLGTAAVSAAGGVFMEKYLHHAAAVSSSSVAKAGSGPGGSAASAAPLALAVSLWEQQCVLALFSAAFALLYVCIFHLPQLLRGELLAGWTGITAGIMAMQAAQGVLVALTIARCGIVFRLILGTLSICLCIFIESLLFMEPVLAREVLTIAMVILGSNLYTTSPAPPTPASSSQLADKLTTNGPPLLLSSLEDGSSNNQPPHASSTEPLLHHHAASKAPPPPPGSSSSSSSKTQGSGSQPQSAALRRLTLLLVATLVYISFSSSFSVMLASKARKDDPTSEAAFLQHSVLSESASEAQRKTEELLRQQAATIAALATAAAHPSPLEAKGGGAGGGGLRLEDDEDPKPPTAGVVVPAAPAPPAEAPEVTRQRVMSELVQRLSDSPNSLLRAAAVTLQRDERPCVVEQHFEDQPWDPRGGAMKRDVAVCVQIKNDAVIMDEYIAFHWVQGAGRFIVYDDDSSDDPWAVLEKYAALGILEFHDMKGHPGSGSNELQTNNYNDCFNRVRQHAHEWGLRWIIFPDIDEFFLPHDSSSTLSQTLNTHFDHSPCLEVARTYFGSSFQHKRPQGLVIENFILASPVGADGFPKMIANVAPVGASRNATALYTVHNIVDQADIPCSWMSETNKHIRIHHYVRSLQDYETKVLTGHKVLNRYVKPLHLFWERDRNERLDTTAADYSCKVKAAMAQLEMIKPSLPRLPRPAAPFDKSAAVQGSEIMMGVA